VQSRRAADVAVFPFFPRPPAFSPAAGALLRAPIATARITCLEPGIGGRLTDHQSRMSRRDAMIAPAAGLALLAAGTAVAQTPPAQQAAPAPAPPPAPPSFDPNSILGLARTIAKTPYKAAQTDLPDFLSSLSYEQYVAIRAKPSALIWADDSSGFAIEPLHRGFIFSAAVQIFLVESGAARPLAYRVSDFDFGSLQPPTLVPDIGFSGFRILKRRDDAYAEIAIFQGASFFRARANGQSLGVTARGLSVRTADARGEEFPIFKAFWIEKPSVADNSIVVHALCDSESTVGVYRMTVRPGEAVIIDTELTLVPRTAVDSIGIATMSAKAISSPLDKRRPDDIRPTIAEVNGLQMLTGKGEWLWRPVTNRQTLQISSFVDDNPKGFGFLMRDRDPDSYLDDDNHWETRPTLWIEPLTDFGPGEVTLVEIPADTETNNNCVAFWKPKGGIEASHEVSWAYRQFWGWIAPSRPPLAVTIASRGGRTPGSKRRRFMVTFDGEILADDKRSPDIKPVLSVSPGTIQSLRWFMQRDKGRCRVVFDIDPGSEISAEIRLVLESGGRPVSETWLYRWTA
jgi:glucans biosynthesis protein